jgi:alanine-synthesizing transaminase
VAVSPGLAFGQNGEGYVRIALVENEQRLRQAVRQIDRALNKGVKAPSATKLQNKARKQTT